jgi:hypothetical protein
VPTRQRQGQHAPCHLASQCLVEGGVVLQVRQCACLLLCLTNGVGQLVANAWLPHHVTTTCAQYFDFPKCVWVFVWCCFTMHPRHADARDRNSNRNLLRCSAIGQEKHFNTNCCSKSKRHVIRHLWQVRALPFLRSNLLHKAGIPVHISPGSGQNAGPQVPRQACPHVSGPRA